jgi:hypothetical protein
MGNSPSLKHHDSQPASASHWSHSSNQAQSGRINTRLMMNRADNSDNRNPQQMQKSMSALRETPVLTLEEACEGLRIPDLPKYVAKAKRYSKNPKKPLYPDEQAAINLYTQDMPLYPELNSALRQSDGRALKWYRYLKLFLTALHKLPPYRGTVWRAVPHGLNANYHKNDEIVWWAFSSCTSSLNIFESNFLGDVGGRTLFNIEVFNGRAIGELSEFAAEDEVLLLPGTHVRVVGELKQPDGLHIIQLKQIEPSYFLFEPTDQADLTHKPVSQHHKQQKKFVKESYSSDDDYSETQSKCTLLITQCLILR